MSFGILQSSREVEGIDALVGVQIDIEIRPSYRIDEGFVLIFWIEDDHVRPEHEGTQDLELHGEGLSSS